MISIYIEILNTNEVGTKQEFSYVLNWERKTESKIHNKSKSYLLFPSQMRDEGMWQLSNYWRLGWRKDVVSSWLLDFQPKYSLE